MEELEKKPLNFLEQIIEEDLSNGFSQDKLKFRFPPEPNGYLHIGHTKAISINFGLGERYNAPVNLRFDDTNPAKEDQEFVDSIKEDIEWLGYKWANECYASDYFDTLYEWAVKLINEGKAYVDLQSSEKINEQRKTPFEQGENSPYRDTSVEENLDLFEKMKNGTLKEGDAVLRAKIDMTSPNMNMRDPVMYRILNKHHDRTGDKWKIYPIYDWIHGESDYLEQISHSLCSLEFKNHRDLYDWYRDQVYEEGKVKNKQREFARLNLSYTVMSKRKLQRLVADKVVLGWDDPRMPTISGLRRKGYTPEAIKDFLERVGVAKRDNIIDLALLEFSVRNHLNKISPRVMAVINPVKLVITNYPEGNVEMLSMENNPEDENAGVREVPFSSEIYIEREDFLEESPNKKFFRLSLGNEVRLKGAYIIKAESVDKNEKGEIETIYCTYDADSKSGSGTEASQRKVKGTLHWVSKESALPIEVRSYDRLFSEESPDTQEEDFMNFINPNSLFITQGFAEPSLKDAKEGDKFQFQRLGYYAVDKDSTSDKLVFNRTVTLKDTWAKMNK